jgi:hypothetical protein
MESSDVLLTTAEVAIAFAGFTGLIAVVAGRGRLDRTSEQFFRLRTMLDYSLAALLAAFFPFLPHAAGLSGSALWQVCSAACVLGTIVYYCFNRALIAPSHPGAGTTMRIGFVGDLLVGVAVALNAVGWVFEPSFLVYLAALYWCLLGAAVGFVQFISVIWAAPRE